MILIVLALAYLIGAIPMGYFLVWLFKGKDITLLGSGRTGGTNAMRAGGPLIGLLTGVFDLSKGYMGVMVAKWLMPDFVWASILAGFMTVLGHNWSIWLFVFSKKFNAGAGTGPNIGAAMAFWPWVAVIAIPVVLFFVFVIGFASLASLSTALLVVVVFAMRTILVGQPWEYIVYGLLTSVLVTWALRPNIKRLLNGTERRVGLFKKKEPKTKPRVENPTSEKVHSSSSNSSSSSS